MFNWSMPPSLFYILPKAASRLQGQSWVVVTKAKLSMKPEYLVAGPLQKDSLLSSFRDTVKQQTHPSSRLGRTLAQVRKVVDPRAPGQLRGTVWRPWLQPGHTRNSEALGSGPFIYWQRRHCWWYFWRSVRMLNKPLTASKKDLADDWAMQTIWKWH